jgi:inosine-uridine nucleoside N-ribohydrolase
VLAAVAVSMVLASCGPSAETSDRGGGARHVVVDTDMGTDDVMALLYLLRRPDVVVDAVTVVGDGLTHLGPGVRNARALLALSGRPDVPVAGGGEQPLAGSNAFPEEWRTFSDDLASIPDLPEPEGEPYEGTAADLLGEELDGDAMLLTLGPLTNVAETLHVDPSIADRVPRVVSMAGAVEVAGNAPNTVAEFNVWIDPVAARDVFDAMPVELVPLDASNAAPVTPFFVDVLGQNLRTPEARAIHVLLRSNPQIEQGTYYFWDPLAAVLLADPDLATWEEAPLLVTASQDAGAGWLYRTDRGPTLRFATRTDGLAFEREFLSTLTGSEIEKVRPDPDLTVLFDGRSTTVEPRSLSAGEHVVVFFDNRSSEPSALYIGTMDGTTYRGLVDRLGGPGSVVEEAPEGFEPVAALEAVPMGQVYTSLELPPGAMAMFSVTAVGQDAGRVWPAGVLRVEGSTKT